MENPSTKYFETPRREEPSRPLVLHNYMRFRVDINFYVFIVFARQRQVAYLDFCELTIPV